MLYEWNCLLKRKKKTLSCYFFCSCFVKTLLLYNLFLLFLSEVIYNNLPRVLGNKKQTKNSIMKNMVGTEVYHGVSYDILSGRNLLYFFSFYLCTTSSLFFYFLSACLSRRVLESGASPIILSPLSTYITWPVIADAKGESKKAATRPTSIAWSSFWKGAFS